MLQGFEQSYFKATVAIPENTLTAITTGLRNSLFVIIFDINIPDDF